MPLAKGCSRTVLAKNIRKLSAESPKRSRAQVIAIALSEARRTGKGRKCRPPPRPLIPSPAHRAAGTHISDSRAASIQRRYDAFQAASVRVGGNDVRHIEKVSGVKRPSNAEVADLETYNWFTKPPAHAFLYYGNDMRTVTGFMGNRLGEIISRGRRVRKMGGETQSVVVRGTNGVEYVGICNLTGGNYCKLRRRR